MWLETNQNVLILRPHLQLKGRQSHILGTILHPMQIVGFPTQYSSARI
jgi:hypothetical protein